MTFGDVHLHLCLCVCVCTCTNCVLVSTFFFILPTCLLSMEDSLVYLTPTRPLSVATIPSCLAAAVVGKDPAVWGHLLKPESPIIGIPTLSKVCVVKPRVWGARA